MEYGLENVCFCPSLMAMKNKGHARPKQNLLDVDESSWNRRGETWERESGEKERQGIKAMHALSVFIIPHLIPSHPIPSHPILHRLRSALHARIPSGSDTRD
jgi:hypothetical protein